MATDERLGYFSARIFQRLFRVRFAYLGIDCDRPSCSPEVQQEISDEMVEACFRAVYCRRQVYTPALRKSIETQYHDFKENFSDFLEFFTLICETSVKYMPIFQKIFTTLAIATHMCDLCCSYFNFFHLQTTHLYWAMFADILMKKDLYAAGGWAQLHAEALNYTSPYEYLTYLAAGREALYYGNSAYVCGVMMAMKNFSDFKEKMRRPTKKTIAFDWVVFQTENPKYEDQKYFDFLMSSIESKPVEIIEDSFIVPLKTLCNPSVSTNASPEIPIWIQPFGRAAKAIDEFMNYMEFYTDSAQQSVSSTISSVLLSDDESKSNSSGESYSNEDQNSNDLSLENEKGDVFIDLLVSKQPFMSLNDESLGNIYPDCSKNGEQSHFENSGVAKILGEYTTKTSFEQPPSYLQNENVDFAHSHDTSIDKNAILNSTLFCLKPVGISKITNSAVEESDKGKLVEDPNCSDCTNSFIENVGHCTLLSALAKIEEKAKCLSVMEEDSHFLQTKSFSNGSKSSKSNHRNEERQSNDQSNGTTINISTLPFEMICEVNKYTPLDSDEKQQSDLTSNNEKHAEQTVSEGDKNEYSKLQQKMQLVMDTLSLKFPSVNVSNYTECFKSSPVVETSMGPDGGTSSKLILNISDIKSDKEQTEGDNIATRVERKNVEQPNSKQVKDLRTMYSETKSPTELMVQLIKELAESEKNNENGTKPKQRNKNNLVNRSNDGLAGNLGNLGPNINTNSHESETDGNHAARVKGCSRNGKKMNSKRAKMQQNGVKNGFPSDSNIQSFKDSAQQTKTPQPTTAKPATIVKLKPCTKHMDLPSTSAEKENAKVNDHSTTNGFESVIGVDEVTGMKQPESDAASKKKKKKRGKNKARYEVNEGENSEHEECNDFNGDKENLKDILRMIFVLGDKVGLEFVRSSLHTPSAFEYPKRNKKKQNRNSCKSSLVSQKMEDNELDPVENSCQQRNNVLNTKL